MTLQTVTVTDMTLQIVTMTEMTLQTDSDRHELTD